MTREEFIKVLDENSYKWTEEGEWIIIEEPGYVGLSYLETIPDNVKFNNVGGVHLDSLQSIPDNIQFNNRGSVDLDSLKSIPNNVKFNNGGDVVLRYLESMGDNVQFRNGGNVHLNSLESIGNNVQFRNGDYVDLTSLKSIPITADIEEMFPKCYDIRINNKWMYLEKNISFLDSRWKSVDGKVKMYESWVKNNY